MATLWVMVYPIDRRLDGCRAFESVLLVIYTAFIIWQKRVPLNKLLDFEKKKYL